MESAFKVDYDLDVNRDADGDEGQTVLRARLFVRKFTIPAVSTTSTFYDYELKKQLAQKQAHNEFNQAGQNWLEEILRGEQAMAK